MILKLEKAVKVPHFDIYTAEIFEHKVSPKTFDLFEDASALAVN